jgi:ATP-dependent DNA helicase DinG
MGERVRVKVPAALGQTSGANVRGAIATAIARGLTPATPPSGVGRGLTIVIGDSERQTLRDYRERCGYTGPLGAFASALLYPYAAATAEAETSGEHHDSGTTPPAADRNEQIVCYEHMRAAIAESAVLLCEADTGVGKTRAALWAIDAERGDQPAVYAVPTLDDLRHVLAEADRGDVTASCVAVLGRANFFEPATARSLLTDPDALSSLPGDPDQREAAIAWIDAGAIVRPDNPTTEALADALPPQSARLLIEDLRHVLAVADDDPLWPGFAAAITRRTADRAADEDALETTIDAMRAATADAAIVVTTHASLALDLWLSRSDDGNGEGSGVIQADYDTLVVDEAHAFEAAVANVVSRGLSVPLVRAAARGLLDVHGAQKTARDVIRACDQAGEHAETAARSLSSRAGPNGLDLWFRPSGLELVRTQQTRALTDAGRRAVRDAIAALRALQKPLSRLARHAGDAQPVLERAAATVRRLSEQQSMILAEISPVRHWLSVTAGPRSVDRLLSERWSNVQALVLMSATLTIEGAQGRSAAHMTRQLGLETEQHRLRIPEPIEARWRYTTPRVHLPATRGKSGKSRRHAPARRLVPPPPTDSDASANWHDAVAAVIAYTIAPSASGGTLVLLPSYALIEALAVRLAPIIEDRLIVQLPATPFAEPRRRFIDAHAAGARPIWLATGPAWEGLDLSLEDDGVAAGEDTLLTDLVMPRIPFGLVQSTTHRARTATPSGHQVIRDEAVFRFRQGLGRLVRRPGLRDRHIWCLDGRPYVAPDAKRRAYYQPFRAFLARHPDRTTIDAVPGLTQHARQRVEADVG